MAAVGGLIHVLEAVESPSHSVELFFQTDGLSKDERIICMVLEHLMREPLYAELRTKKQLGYSVKCGSREVCNSLGFVVEITSDTKGPEKCVKCAPRVVIIIHSHRFRLAEEIDAFLLNFRSMLDTMPESSFIENLCGLANVILEKPSSLASATAMNWRTIVGHVFYNYPYSWNRNIHDARVLRTVATRTRVLECFDRWLNPASPNRRRSSVFVVGFGYDVEKLVVALTKVCVCARVHGSNMRCVSQQPHVTLTSVDGMSKRRSRFSTKCLVM